MVDSVLEHIEKLLRLLREHFYPSSKGYSKGLVIEFVDSILKEICKRVKKDTYTSVRTHYIYIYIYRKHDQNLR